MSGETEKQVSGWTVDTMHQHLIGIMDERDTRYQQRFDAQQLGLTDALKAAEKAVVKAEVATDKRFEGVNEFRETLSDQANTFMTRHEYSAAHDALVEKVEAIAKIQDNAVGHSQGLTAGWGYLVAAVGLAVAIVTVIIATRP